MGMIHGERQSFWIMISFVLGVLFFIWFIKHYWVLVLDEGGVVSLFRKLAAHYDSRVKPVHQDYQVSNGRVVESGYRFTIWHAGNNFSFTLARISHEETTSKRLTYHHSLLVVRCLLNLPLNLVLVNPTFEIDEATDVEFLAPLVVESSRYLYTKQALVFSNYDKAEVKQMLGDRTINQELSTLFVDHRFKFIAFQEGEVRAVKDAFANSIAKDIETYPRLLEIGEVLSAVHANYETSTIGD